MYYGTEQLFNGGNDPENREVLWTSMKTDTDMYKFIGLLNQIRKQQSVWEHPQIERWVDDSFYSFSRGKLLVALTNDDSGNSQ